MFFHQSLRLYGFKTNHFCFAHVDCRCFMFFCCHNENFQSDCARSNIHMLHEIYAKNDDTKWKLFDGTRIFGYHNYYS